MEKRQRGKRALALLLALALMLALCACGRSGDRETAPDAAPDDAPLSFAEKMERSDALLQETGSMHMDMAMTMAMTVTVGGNSQRSEMEMDAAVDVLNDPAQMAMEMEMRAGDSSQRLRSYAEQNDGGVDVYVTMDDGAHWQKQRADALEDVTPQNAREQLEMFRACAASFAETGHETLDGVALTVYTGAISGDYVERTIREAGTLEQLAQAMGGQITEDMFRDLDEIPVTVGIEDRSCRVRYYVMDMGPVMQTLMERAMEAMLATMGVDGMEISLAVEQVQIRVDLSRFDELEPIQIPDEARAA